MKKGFTLIELVMVIVVVSALAIGTAPFINAVVERWKFLQFRDDIGAQARIALDWMMREIREVKDKNSIDTASETEFKFTDSNDASVDYVYASNTITRNGDDLAEDITSFQFTYKDKYGNTLSSPVPDTTKIYLINVTLTATSGNQSLHLETEIFPRNLGV